MDAIIEYRKRKGLSQQELANLLGVAQTFISKLERGERTLAWDTAIEWETRLGRELTRHDLAPHISAAYRR